MLYNKVVVESVSVSVYYWLVYGILLHHDKETFNRNVCRPATKVIINGCGDWDKCIFCQDNKDEALQWPLGTKRFDRDPLKPYEKAALRIQEFVKIGSLPMQLNMAFLDEGRGIAPGTLFDNQANWHTNCRNICRFSELKLDREISKSQKRKSSDIYTTSNTKKATRQRCTLNNISKESCFFCDQSSEEIHLVSTMNLDINVRKCTMELQDTILLAIKVAAGDMISQNAVYHRACLVALYNRPRAKNIDKD